MSEANSYVVMGYSRFYDFENPYETSKKIAEVGSLLPTVLHINNPLCTYGLAVNHLDFQRTVGNIHIREYNEGIARRDSRFNGPPNESCSTGSDEDTSAGTTMTTRPVSILNTSD